MYARDVGFFCRGGVSLARRTNKPDRMTISIDQVPPCAEMEFGRRILTTSFRSQIALAHGCPDFLRILTCKCHIILRCSATFKIEVQQSSSKVSFPDQVEIDRNVTRTFFILH
jgi:hypothetical protein